MTAVRVLALAGLSVAAVVLQVSLFSFLAVDGVAPNLMLLLVVAAGLSRSAELAMLLGFVGGLVLDLAPPADHVAGRSALALVVVGYLAGRVGRGGPVSTLAAVATVAGCSFVGTSLFALSGMVLHDPAVPVAEALQVIPVAVLYDVVLAPFVLPPLMRLLRRIEPARVAY
jgi:rod shape-determining protein MreD